MSNATAVAFTQRWAPYIAAMQKAEDERLAQVDCNSNNFHKSMLNAGFSSCPYCGDNLNEINNS